MAGSGAAPQDLIREQNMRIIAGERRGRKLLSPEGTEVRPTTNMVKESVFNILQFGIEGRRFLDLFAGSGQMGLEALSRGAREAVFVDSSRESLRVIEKNIESAGFGDRAKVAASDFAGFLKAGRDSFDVAFIDPPYREGLMERALELTALRMSPGGVILCEHGSREELPERAGEFFKAKVYKYGRTSVTAYRAGEKQQRSGET